MTREADRLYAPMTNQPRFQIFPRSPTDYFWKVVNAHITFAKDDEGKVIKAMHQQGGTTIEAPKIE